MLDKIETRWIPMKDSDPGYQGFLALPPAGHGPGLVLFQEIFGVNTHIRSVAQQYALDGFVVLAPDIFWRQAPKVELGYEGEERNRGVELMKQLTPEGMKADVQAAVATLRASEQVGGRKVGAVGYCLGGRLSYFAAAHTDVDAAVAYYGGGIHDKLELAPSIRAPMQFHYAETDASIPMEAVEKVRVAMGERAEVFVYPGATHGFNCWDRAAYHPASSALAHGRTLAFFAQKLY